MAAEHGGPRDCAITANIGWRRDDFVNARQRSEQRRERRPIAVQQQYDTADARSRRRHEARELDDIAEALLAIDDERPVERRAVPDRESRERGLDSPPRSGRRSNARHPASKSPRASSVDAMPNCASVLAASTAGHA